MGRRGPKPDYAKREAYAKLMAEGVPSAQACRIVGIYRRAGTHWRNGRRIPSGGRVLNLPPVITISPVPEKRYSPRYLSEDERLRLADLRRERRTMREIAVLMGRSTSTISRELARGADAAGRYRPFEAHRRALGRRPLHRPSRLAGDAELRDWVAGKLKARWSPEQVSRELRRQFPDQRDRWLCAETIYQAVYRPDLGGLPRELPGWVLHNRRRHRLARRHAQARRSGSLARHHPDRRSPHRGSRARRAGHWEGDLIMGAANASAIVTMVERVTRYTLLGHLPGPRHDSASVRDAVVAALAPLPANLRRTLTWDQGSEMARHAEIAAALATTEIYFCDPHSPWQRPSNENTNGLLRDYFPKSTDLSVHTADDLARVQTELNRRPRKILVWDSPADRMATLLETTSVLRRSPEPAQENWTVAATKTGRLRRCAIKTQIRAAGHRGPRSPPSAGPLAFGGEDVVMVEEPGYGCGGKGLGKARVEHLRPRSLPEAGLWCRLPSPEDRIRGLKWLPMALAACSRRAMPATTLWPLTLPRFQQLRRRLRMHHATCGRFSIRAKLRAA